MIWRKLHLYVALTAGVLFALLGLTGSWLAFYPQLDSQLLGFDSKSSGAPHWQRTVDAATRATGVPVHMSMLMLPWGEHGTALVLMQTGQQMVSLDFSQAYVDPGQAKVHVVREALSSRQDWRTNLSGFAFAIHSGFFLGVPGAAAVGILALFLLFSVITGLYWWWPRGRWRATLFKLSTKPGSRAFLADLHRVSGLYASLLLGLVAVTGFHYAFQPLTRAAVAALLPTAQAGWGASSHAEHGNGESTGVAAAANGAMSIDGAIERARQLFPDRALKGAMILGAPHPMFQVQLAPQDRVSPGVGATQVMFDAASGAVLSVTDPQRERAGDTLLRWLIPLHSGEAFGLAGRIVMCVTGLLPTLFFVTGVWMWLRRTRATRRAAAPQRAVNVS